MKIGDLMRSPLGQMAAPSLPMPMPGLPGPTQQPGYVSGGQPGLEQVDLSSLMAQRPEVKQWQKILGTIGDALQVAGGGRASFGPSQQEQQASDEDWQRQVAIEQYKARQRLEEKRAEAMRPPPPTAMERNFQWYNTLPPEQQAAFARYQDVVQPKFVPDGYGGGQTVSRSGGGMPPQYDPEEWEVVEGPQGGAGSDQPGFR